MSTTVTGMNVKQVRHEAVDPRSDVDVHRGTPRVDQPRRPQILVEVLAARDPRLGVEVGEDRCELPGAQLERAARAPAVRERVPREPRQLAKSTRPVHVESHERSRIDERAQ